MNVQSVSAGFWDRFLRPFRRTSVYEDVSHDIYGAVVAQSRLPVFFLDYGIPDTVTGRFDMLCLHMFLLSNRLAHSGEDAAKGLNQAIFDRFCDDVDRALREIGIGDTSVPKRKKKLIHGFYGQIDDFSEALGAGDVSTLTMKVTERFGSAGAVQAGRLARYMIEARDRLAAVSPEKAGGPGIDWPDPERLH